MENPKFKVGDTLVRTAYKDSESAFIRDEFTVTEICRDDRPFCAQLWYIGKNFRGKVVSGLVCVVDEAFCLKQ